jgi:ribonuclease HII
MISDLIFFENELYKKGVRLIAGVDEVGRGPLAGPFVAGAVILDLEKVLSLARNNDVEDQLSLDYYNHIKDSKKLSIKRRSEINQFLLNAVVSYSIVEISCFELDKIGVSQATQKAFYGCIQKLSVKPEHILTDAFEIKKITKETQTNIKEGDNRSISIAAASIMAKVYRDRVMDKMHLLYPQYGFDRNKGYGTKRHLEALCSFGACPIHRRSFHPVSNYLQTPK